MNEVRLIAWPWFVMTVAALAPLIKLGLTDKKSDWPDAIAVFGFFGGAAVLTARSFRSGPWSVSEGGYKIWTEKMLAITLTGVSAGLIACFVQAALGTIEWEHFQLDHAVEPVLLLSIIICSTGFWTLLTRSVAGGIILTAAAQLVLYLLLVLFVTLINRMAPVSRGETNLVHAPEVHAALSWFVCGFGLSYAAIMLWLGRKRFTRQPSAV